MMAKTRTKPSLHHDSFVAYRDRFVAVLRRFTLTPSTARPLWASLANKHKQRVRYFILKLIFLLAACSVYSQSQIKITSANINLRSTPYIDTNILCVIPKSTTLTIDYSNQQYLNWIKVTYKGKTGYVFGNYLKDLELKTVFGNSYSPSTTSSKVTYYTNSQGYKVQSPTYYNSPPAGATALCRDGTYSFSRSRKGTCSHHGGVARWL
jgi:uncharacterized protein YgiM (DUF1202 family)